MITDSLLKLCVRRAVNNVIAVEKILGLYYNYADKTITFDLVVSKKLEDEELEEARIAQTELLADFPDGEIRKFVINQYLVCDDDGQTEKMISGERFYESNEMKRREEYGEVQAYKLIDSEKAEMEN